MKRVSMCVLAAFGCGVALAQADIPPPRPVNVAALVKQLGSEEFAEREEACRRLSTLHVDEIPSELLAALRSENPEIRQRAAVAVKSLREFIPQEAERVAISRLPRGERFAKRGQIDLYVASTAVTGYKEDDPRLWEPVLDVGRAAVKKGEMTRGRAPNGCSALFPDVSTYKKSYDIWFARMDEPYDKKWRGGGGIQAPGVRDTLGFGWHTVVSRGSVKTAGCQYSLILATGDLESGDDISGSVVICDGDVLVGGNTSTCLIIARGSISIKGTASSSTLIAGKTVAIAKPSDIRRQIAPGDPELQRMNDQSWHSFRVISEEHITKPLGYITFFELTTVGVDAKLADKAVKITSLTPGNPFADAGVKVGDIVVEVNGKKPDSPEALRRLLRDALAIGDATVKLQRGDKTVALKVALPE